MALPMWAQYAGPAILSRGESPAALSSPQIDFRPYLAVTGVYDTGLSGVSLSSDTGALAYSAGEGVELTAGVSGFHTWRHTKLGLDYTGSLRHYLKRTYYDGTDHSLMLSLNHQINRHITLGLRENAGIFTRNFGTSSLLQTAGYDASSTYVPTTDYFDNRTLYLSTQADLTIQRSTRLSFNLGADGFVVKRRSNALYGSVGSAARGDIEYRWTRRTTVGLNYSFTHYDFTKTFGATDAHSLGFAAATRLTRTLEVSAFGGEQHVETKFVRAIAVDPVVAALLGITQGHVVVHRIDYIPFFSARLSNSFKRGVVYVSGEESIRPGNGLFLTSKAISGSTGCNYTGLRRWSINANATYTRSSAVSNVTGSYSDATASVSVSRQLGRSFHIVASGAAHRYQSGDFTQYNRTVYEARLGLGFAPGNIPLRIR
jgi:hypothetical protein